MIINELNDYDIVQCDTEEEFKRIIKIAYEYFNYSLPTYIKLLNSYNPLIGYCLKLGGIINLEKAKLKYTIYNSKDIKENHHNVVIPIKKEKKKYEYTHWEDSELIEIAKKYKHRVDFLTFDNKAYYASIRRGDEFFNSICNHMVGNTYWDDIKVSIEAKKFKYRNEFKNNRLGAYRYSIKRGKEFMDSICSHMVKYKKPIKWTESLIIEEAKKYKTRSEFQKESCSYIIARKKGKVFLDSVCSHMKSKSFGFTEDDLRIEALKYSTKNEFKIRSQCAYKYAKKIGKDFYESICSHMTVHYHSIEMIIEESKKYKSKKELKDKDFRLYVKLVNRKLLNTVFSK